MMRLDDSAATEKFGFELGERLQAGDVVALFGDLGAGKTTLSRGILRGLGFRGEVASPTFPIVQPYEMPEVSLPLWHIDLYRIDDPAEIQELALDEALNDGALIIEWPARMPRLWPQTLILRLAIVAEGARALTAQVPPAWEGRWPLR